MKKIFRLLLAVLLVTTLLTGCGEKKDRVLYNNVDLGKYVELGKYKDIAIDTSTEKFEGYYGDVVTGDITKNGFYEKKTEGVIANGDVANIDYEGKLNGVAFQGGTAKGYDLEIGSGSFIDGFESGLVGVSIGSTVDLNLTFPSNYGNAELAGKAVVFTVKVNYVVTDTPLKPEAFCEELGFKSLKAYEADATKRAVKEYILDTVFENSKVSEYPKKDKEFLLEQCIDDISKQISEQTGETLAVYLQYIGQTEEEFRKSALKEQVQPAMKQQMILYAILDDAGLEVTEKDVDKIIADSLKQINNSQVKKDDLLEYYGEYYFELLAVKEKTLDYLYKKAKIS